MLRPDFLSAIHLQDDLVRPPVRHKVHDAGEQERRDETLRASEKLAERKQKAAEEAEQQDSF
jgi:hypothetical protein